MGHFVLAGCLIGLPLAVMAQEGMPETKMVGGHAITSSRVSQDLQALHERYRAHLQTAPEAAFQPGAPAMPVRGGRVVVDAVASEDGGALLLALEALGLQDGAANGRMVSGELPIGAIPGLERMADLNFIRPAYMEAGAGLTTSQGDIALRASAARTGFAVDGAGLTIGTLSDSFNCLGGASADVASGDLPDGISAIGRPASCANAADEGRAMMQIIHDLAPGARQAFHSAFRGQADFANGIYELATAANCDIICDDVFYFAEPFFQDGIIAQAVDRVVSIGIPYFALAGNHGRKSYEDAFRPSGISPPGYADGDAHDFDPGEGVDVYQRVRIRNTATVSLSFQWDQPFFSVSGAPGSSNDMDILLYDDPPTTVLASSAGFNVGRDPVELLTYTNNTGRTDFNIALVQWNRAGGPVPRKIKYIALVNGALPNFAPQEWDTRSSTIYGHMNAGLGETVGAAFYHSTPAFGVAPPRSEAYSSSGRTPILFDIGGNPVSILRDKPDIVATDGVNTTFFGADIPDPGDGSDRDAYPNFYGTSAATPHAAAVAALLLDYAPGLTPEQVTSTLETSAIDMAAPGWDEDTGFGLIQADAALCLWDHTPPAITCPSDITVECADLCGVPASNPQPVPFLGGASATDGCDASPAITNDAPACFPKGTTRVMFTATDHGGNRSACSANLNVVDTTPPVITVSLNRTVLWPPNHKMADIAARVNVTDACSANPAFVVTSVTSNEPEDDRGDGSTSPDILGADLGTADTSFQLRSERRDGGDGRVYAIVYTASDGSGNTARDTATVRVPHDQSGRALACTGRPTLHEWLGIDPTGAGISLVPGSMPAP